MFTVICRHSTLYSSRPINNATFYKAKFINQEKQNLFLSSAYVHSRLACGESFFEKEKKNFLCSAQLSSSHKYIAIFAKIIWNM